MSGSNVFIFVFPTTTNTLTIQILPFCPPPPPCLLRIVVNFYLYKSNTNFISYLQYTSNTNLISLILSDITISCLSKLFDHINFQTGITCLHHRHSVIGPEMVTEFLKISPQTASKQCFSALSLGFYRLLNSSNVGFKCPYLCLSNYNKHINHNNFFLSVPPPPHPPSEDCCELLLLQIKYQLHILSYNTLQMPISYL